MYLKMLSMFQIYDKNNFPIYYYPLMNSFSIDLFKVILLQI